MEKEEALEEMDRYDRYSITVDLAKDICKAFGVKLPKKLIRKPGVVGYRELVYAEEEQESVVMSVLAAYLCEKLGLTPDFTRANQMIGVGSYHSAITQACIKVLKGDYIIEGM